jgi:hypothetical protein
MEEFNISQSTAKKYIHMSEEDRIKLDTPTVYKKRKTVTDDYLYMIYKMAVDGIEPEIIFSYIYKKGYTGTGKALDTRIVRLLKNNFGIILYRGWYLKYRYPPEITIIKRSELLKYITTKNEKTKKSERVEKNIEIIKERYPIVNELEKI